MQDAEQLSLEQIQVFLEGSEEVQLKGKKRQEVYDWITRLMRRQEFRKQGKAVRGLLLRYMAKMTAKPGAGDEAGGPVPEKQRSEGGGVSPEPVSEPLHASRHRTAGEGG
jgi:hypothetical protein